MSRDPSKGEADAGAAGAEPDVQARLEEIRRDKRGRMRWGLSRHTAERALMAISDVAPRPAYRASSKSRRRKRHKRLL
jgi:hypothetical protein